MPETKARWGKLKLSWSTWNAPNADDSVGPGAVLASHEGDWPFANSGKPFTLSKCYSISCYSCTPTKGGQTAGQS